MFSLSQSKSSRSPSSSGVFTNIFTPRPYQIELLECAVKQNTLVCVNTEAGKRFISTMLIREMVVKNEDLQQQMQLAILLLNDEILIKEQGELLQKHLNLDVMPCTKDICSSLTSEAWKTIFMTHQVITISPELLLEALHMECSLVQLLYLIIFDECQLVCNKNHPYKEILKILDENRVTPNILGLTMSLLCDQSNSISLRKEIEKMECLLRSKAQTATDLIALDRHSLLLPSEKIILSADRNKDQDIAITNLSDEIQRILRNGLIWLKDCQIEQTTAVRIIDWEVAALFEGCHDGSIDYNESINSYSNGTSDSGDFIESTNDLNKSSESHTHVPYDQTEDVCGYPRSLLQAVLTVLDVLGPWCVYKLSELIIRHLHKSLLGIERRLKASIGKEIDDEPTSGRLLWKKLLFQYVNTKLRAVFALCHRHIGKSKTVDLKFVSPKVHRLFQVLKEYKPISEPDQKQEHKYNDRREADYVSWWQDSDADEEDDYNEIGQKRKNQKSNGSANDDSYTSPFTNTLCGIVFVEDDYVALMLHRLLKEVCANEKELKHVNSSHLGISPEKNPYADLNLAVTEKAKQEEVVRKFRCHETNLLITTGELENCAYIPKCNLVVRFDVAKSYRSYTQCKCKARAPVSAYVMLVRESEKHQFMETLQEYKRIEQVLKGSSCLEEDEGILEDNGEGVEYDDMIEPYTTPSNAIVNMSNAIKIINRYCGRLPSDPFTHLSPRCEVSEASESGYLSGEQMYRCTLQLPINSHAREPIKGILMPTVILAQQAVAVETCKKLHLSGELDNNLMPIGKETVKYAEELDPWKPEPSPAPGRPGSTKRRQTYTKDVPFTLTSCLPNLSENVFIYEIEMRIKKPMPEQLNVRMRKIYFPEDTSRCFGILTTKQIPEIPGTPIFTRSGEEVAQLKLCRAFVNFNDQELKLIKSFHRYVFSDMLRVDRVPLAFKPDEATNQIFVVVLNKVPSSRFCPNLSRLDIDWSFMLRTDAKRRTAEKIKRDPWYHHRMSEKKKTFTFNKNTYEDAVVVAKYRSCDQPNRFYVAEIKDNLNPSSPFPSSEYQSFKQYYSMKYSLDIRCNEQPLLDVDHTSTRLNLLTPRHMNQKGKALPMSSLEKKRAKYESLHNRQILVPELCEAHPIPASLWRKAVCLPSILYRISQLLVAEELRQDVAMKCGITTEHRPVGHAWPGINFNWSGKQLVCFSPNKINKPLFQVANLKSENCLNMEDLSISSGTKHSASEIKLSITKGDGNQMNVDSSNPKANLVGKVSEAKITSDAPHIGGSNSERKAHLKPLKEVQKNSPAYNELRENFQHPIHPEDDASVPSAVETPHVNENIPNHVYDLKLAVEDMAGPQTNTKDSGEKVVDISSDEGCLSDVSFFSDDYENCFESDVEQIEERKKKKRKHIRKFRGSQSDLFHVIPKSLFSDVVFDERQIGPGPELILQALTLSNASDGFNLERLEMLGDSFLKHAVTLYLYCTYPEAHEGKLSYMRSKKVSNYNLYRIGRAFGLAGKMTAHIFDPTVNWMPPGFIVGSSINGDDSDNFSFSDDEVEIGVWTGVPKDKKKSTPIKSKDTQAPKPSTQASTSAPSSSATAPQEEIEEEFFEEDEIRMIDGMLGGCLQQLGGVGIEKKGNNGMIGIDLAGALSGHQSMHFTDKAALKHSAAQAKETEDFVIDTWTPVDAKGKPLNNTDPLMLELHTQHSLADKSIADSVEALLGAYLTSCGHRAAQIFLCHIGLTVLPKLDCPEHSGKTAGQYGYLQPPPNNFTCQSFARSKLDQLLQGLKGFEKKINYCFKNKAYLLQAFTHASYYYNTVTDCYQRLEFLGDAVLDFLITRHLFNDVRQHSPGALTDLRSALVNNTIFASLAVRHDFHKYFKAISPELQQLVEDFVSYQWRQEETQGMDAQLMRCYGDNSVEQDDNSSFIDCDEEEGETEDVEVPKALGDIFESVAGAVFMDSGMDLNTVWDVYSVMMLPLIEKFSACVPRSPVRELLEMEPETAKFSAAEKRYDGKVRVTVEIIGKGRFKGVGRSYRIAKSAAARRALRFLKSKGY